VYEAFSYLVYLQEDVFVSGASSRGLKLLVYEALSYLQEGVFVSGASSRGLLQANNIAKNGSKGVGVQVLALLALLV
jgi:hypothetical protein